MTPRKVRKRGRPPLADAERKDKLVQARVPEDLDATLREEAKRSRVSVSQLVRNVLEDAFQLVDGVVANTARLTDSVQRDARRIADAARGKKPVRGAFDDVYAWQEVVVQRATTCARCDKPLATGDRGAMGLTDDADAPRRWLCGPCLREV
jgi:hypothetical protein